jgi:hypothetical protein
MKKQHSLIGILILLFATLCLVGTASLKMQPAKEASSSLNRAAKGDTVWVLLNHIKADKCEQFEKFVHDILWPIALESDPISQQVAHHTRVLHPVEMNKDSTFTYIFIMDPVIQGANYQFSYYLKKKYDEEKTKEYLKMVNECYATPQTGYAVVQSQH